MNVFILDADGNQYQNLVFTAKNDWAILRQFDGRRLFASWTAPAVEVFRDDKFNRNLPPSDFPSLAPGVPVFSLRAVNALQGLLRENGEILPLSCNEGEYYAFNVTKSIDALDEFNSQVKRFESSGRIMRILKYAFFGDRLGGATIFKIPQSRGNVFVTNRFRKIAMDNALLGFKFINVWEG
ncbi:MAG: DUF1629 domain-containing protein [Syntrophobacteraceae bacterium]